MKRINIVLVIILCFVVADLTEGAEGDLIQGNTIMPLQKQNVRMVSEDVMVSEQAKVVGTYVFENLTGNQLEMKMGFPFRSTSPKNFKVWIEGKPVAVEKQSKLLKGEIVLKDKYSGFSYDVLAWKISFASREKKSVKIEYNTAWGSGMREETAPYYVFATVAGALWSGDIERADFQLKLDPFAAELLKSNKYKFKIVSKPDGNKIVTNQVEWHFRNWKPKQNLGVAVIEEDATLLEIFLNILKHSEEILVQEN